MNDERAEPGELPLLPGFREMALRRMIRERQGLVAELAEQRQSAGLSQTEIAARMGTSQSAVARLEAGQADVRASTLERYAAALGSQISWRLGDGQLGDGRVADRRLANGRPGDGQPGDGRPGDGQPRMRPEGGSA
jgi:transcriptional regulator with XRE-family HTH domain